MIQELASNMASELARNKDDVLLETLIEAVGEDYLLASLIKRMNVVSYSRSHEIYFLDGEPLITFYEPECEEFNGVLTFTQKWSKK